MLYGRSVNAVDSPDLIKCIVDLLNSPGQTDSALLTLHVYNAHVLIATKMHAYSG